MFSYANCLHPTFTIDHNVIGKYHNPLRILPDCICQPIHHHCEQEGQLSDVIPSHHISVSWCMSCTSLTYFFATPDFPKHSHSSSLCTLLLIFSRSTKTEHLFLTFSVHLHQHFLLQLCASPLFRMSNAQEVANNPRATSQFLQASVICEILHFMTGELEKDGKIWQS